MTIQLCVARLAVSEEESWMRDFRVGNVREEDGWGGRQYDLDLEKHQEFEGEYSAQPPRG